MLLFKDLLNAKYEIFFLDATTKLRGVILEFQAKNARGNHEISTLIANALRNCAL